MDFNMCIGCHQDNTPMVIIDELHISICANCGTLYIQEKQLIISLTLKTDNRLYAIAQGMATLYKEYAGDLNNAPSVEDYGG